MFRREPISLMDKDSGRRVSGWKAGIALSEIRKSVFTIRNPLCFFHNRNKMFLQLVFVDKKEEVFLAAEIAIEACLGETNLFRHQ